MQRSEQDEDMCTDTFTPHIARVGNKVLEIFTTLKEGQEDEVAQLMCDYIGLPHYTWKDATHPTEGLWIGAQVKDPPKIVCVLNKATQAFMYARTQLVMKLKAKTIKVGFELYMNGTYVRPEGK